MRSSEHLPEPIVYGIGLPRTGTTSLSWALSSMGIETSHSCILHDNVSPMNRKSKVPTALVDNALFKSYKGLVENSNNSLFILTTRCPREWERSIERFYSVTDTLPDVHMYEKETINFFRYKKAAHRLLVINIFEDCDSLQKVAKFVGMGGIKGPFPHVKKENEEK